jgi:hypothetical protein
MYIHLDSLKKMKQDAADFVRANSRVTAAASGGAQ